MILANRVIGVITQQLLTQGKPRKTRDTNFNF